MIRRMGVVVFSSATVCLSYAFAAAVPDGAAVAALTPQSVTAAQDLSGMWRFSPTAAEGFEASEDHAEWREIPVPGEWEMQGFHVKPETPAAYFRTFDAGALRAGERLMLRFDAVYSLCRVWVNGRSVGGHEGGFVPFEFDITGAARSGTNTLAVSVQSESLSDDLSYASIYAAHPLGGISRKVTLFRVPETHVSELRVETVFDAAYRDATLTVRCAVRNASARPAEGLALRADIAGASGGTEVPVLASGDTADVTFSLQVTRPAQWDCEHPRLHTLRLALRQGARTVETIEEAVGFRQVEVRGQRVYVNGRPIKLHGVCRHEVHPLLGRALTNGLWEADARLFREMNCNFIRTSHYPPAPEFLQACDRLGLFVELEAGLCWVSKDGSRHYKKAADDQAVLDRLTQANLETVRASYNHPSVILRSLANESNWCPMFERVAACVRKADPTRPMTFHDQCWGEGNNGGSVSMPVGNYHYPSQADVAKTDREPRPIQFGEFCHLNTYNRREIVTDPGVRDLYGEALKPMWDTMVAAPGNLGGSIWSGLDDVFLLPDGRAVGYGEWGPLDGWRRLKPEAWHIKKSYTPVRVLGAARADGGVRVEVENRSLFSSLGEYRIEWAALKAGEAVRQAALTRLASDTAGISAGERGTFVVPTAAPDELYVRFTAPDGVCADEERLTFGKPPVVADNTSSVAKADALKVETTDDTLTVDGGAFRWTVSRTSGLLIRAETGGNVVLDAGPRLMILPLTTGPCATEHSRDIEPLNASCAGWVARSVTHRVAPEAVTVEVEGSYAEADGRYSLTFERDGALVLDYTFNMKTNVNPRQWGMVFFAPGTQSRIAWSRRSFWSVYPEGHLGRPFGTASAELKGRDAFLRRTPPAWPWEQDENTLGSADFRATRAACFWFRLDDPVSGSGFRVESDGRQAARAWRAGDASVGLLIAGFNTGGGDSFLARHYEAQRRPLAAGDTVRDHVRLRIIKRAESF